MNNTYIILGIIENKARQKEEASSYQYVIDEYRKLFPSSFKYGLKDDTIKRIVRKLEEMNVLEKKYIEGEALFMPSWVKYWGVSK